jgi:hypothetical protein
MRIDPLLQYNRNLGILPVGELGPFRCHQRQIAILSSGYLYVRGVAACIWQV